MVEIMRVLGELIFFWRGVLLGIHECGSSLREFPATKTNADFFFKNARPLGQISEEKIILESLGFSFYYKVNEDESIVVTLLIKRF